MIPPSFRTSHFARPDVVRYGRALRPSRRGYIFLLSVLFVSTIAISVLSSYMLLSIGSMQNGSTLQASAQAIENARTCAEHALMQLFLDSGYVGDESLTLSEGTCDILVVGGFGNEDRTVCTEGVYGSHVRRMELVVERIVPTMSMYSWQEVASISSCSY